MQESQPSSKEQIILACDDSGKFQEYIPRKIGHTGKGRRHLAITVLIYNLKEEVLLQKRKHQVFDNIWCFSADTHPYHLPSGDESIEEATLRALKEDFAIKDAALKNLGSFNYFAKDEDNCENEHCAMLVGEYNGDVSLNPASGYEYVWMSKSDFLTDFENNPKKYAPWVPGGVAILQMTGFFN